MKFRRILTALLAAAVAVGTVGCGGKKEKTVSTDTGEIPKNLTIFSGIASYAVKAGAEDNNALIPFQMMEEMTGCHVEWIHPATGAEQEQLNLLITSGNLPDMIVTNWKTITGGEALYAEDEVIIPLRDLMEDNMPYLWAYLEENPKIEKQTVDDDGEIYSVPFIRGDEELKVYEGPQIRRDWLKKLGLEMPETPDELYNVLKAFKTGDPNGNGKADEIPMSGCEFEHVAMGIGNLLWGFGTTYDFYLKDGSVTHGILEPEFEEGMKYIAKLYSEGLIDVDYLLNDRTKMDNKMMNDKVGFLYSLQPGNYYANMNDGTREVIGTKHFSKDDTTPNVFDQTYINDVPGYACIAVTTENKNPSGSLKWLDNFFGGKGLEIMNFGKEGLTFNYVDGEPILSDYIFNNPDGLTSTEAVGISIGAAQSSFPTIQDWRYYRQILPEWSQESIENWNVSKRTDAILPLLKFSSEENEEIAQKMSQISTYFTENINKIVIGQLDVSEISTMREKMIAMGLNDVIKIYNEAYKRYNER